MSVSVLESLKLREIDLRIRIPPSLLDSPVLSSLIRDFDLRLNIESAQLSQEACVSGWFHLHLSGQSEQIRSALGWLQEKRVEVWLKESHSNW